MRKALEEKEKKLQNVRNNLQLKEMNDQKFNEKREKIKLRVKTTVVS